MSSGRAMATLGPILPVILRPNPGAVRAMARPNGERVAMLIDTGAECTMVDDRTPRALGHEPDYFTLIVGATGEPETLPVYRMEMIVRMVDAAGISHDVAFRQTVVGLEPRPYRVAGFGLLGRDYLTRMRFAYDGLRGAFSLIRDEEPEG
jgi:hypothetical protein